MVFQKKGGVKGKQQTPSKPKNKKAVENNVLGDIDMDFDLDSDGSESGDQVVKKTPGDKTPKRKLSQNDKRVSFQIPGKNTLANKTPKNENTIGKKQLTPAAKATNLKEFQGMLSNNSAKKNGSKKHSEDEEEEEDDDDDDDGDLDMLLGGDDEEEEDDDDDSRDEDDDDDSEEEEDQEEERDEDDEEEKQRQKKQNLKQQSLLKSNLNKKEASVEQNKTLVKNIEEMPAKNTDRSPKILEKQGTTGDKNSQKDAQTPAKAASPKKSPEKGALDKRENRTLYLGNLPKSISAAELKALSTDIEKVKLAPGHPRKNKKTTFAFLEFASEAKAEENYKILKNKKFKGEVLAVDFTGAKRQNQPCVQSDKNVNKKLFISSLPGDVTIYQVAQFFPKAYQITLNRKHAMIFYIDEKDAADALEASKSAKLGGKPLTVSYSVPRDKDKKRKRSNHPRNPAAKKIKSEVKQGSEEEDNDDDNDE